MINIFISHAWSETSAYERFVGLLDESLGRNHWRNVSIPRSEAIDLSTPREWSLEVEYEELEDRLVQVEAELRRPDLPDAITRVVWDLSGQRREEPTVGTLRAEKESLLWRIRELSSRMSIEQGEPPRFRDPKDASSTIRFHPDLSLAIRRRISTAQLVFVLLTPFCRLHRWVDFELVVSAGLPVAVVGVTMGTPVSHDLHIDCNEVVPWDRVAIKRIVAAWSKTQVHDAITEP